MRLEFIAILVAYIVVGTAIALFSRRYGVKSTRDYYIARGMLGGLVAAGTYAATTYSAFMMIGLVGLAYGTGVGALGFELVYLVATVLLLSTVGKEIWRLSKQRGWITPSQMLGELYGSKLVSTLVALVYLFAMLPYLAAQIQGLRAVFEYGGFGSFEALTISALVTYAWIFIAGAWSVALTDLYQGLLAIAGGFVYLAWIALCFTPSLGLSYSTLLEVLGENGYLGISSFWKPHVFLAYTLPWVFFSVTNPQVVVRLYMPRDKRAYRDMVLYFSLYGFLYTVIAVTVGLLSAGLALTGKLPLNLKWDEVTPTLLNHMNPILGSLIAVSIVAAAVSTANSIVLAVSSGIVMDLLHTECISLARLVDAGLVLAATLIAMQSIGFIVEMSVLTSIILLPLAPITLLGVYRHRRFGRVSRLACVLSLVLGLLVSVLYSVVYGPRKAFTQPLLEAPIAAWVLIVSTLVLVAGHLLDIFSKNS